MGSAFSIRKKVVGKSKSSQNYRHRKNVTNTKLSEEYVYPVYVKRFETTTSSEKERFETKSSNEGSSLSKMISSEDMPSHYSNDGSSLSKMLSSGDVPSHNNSWYLKSLRHSKDLTNYLRPKTIPLPSKPAPWKKKHEDELIPTQHPIIRSFDSLDMSMVILDEYIRTYEVEEEEKKHAVVKSTSTKDFK